MKRRPSKHKVPQPSWPAAAKASVTAAMTMLVAGCGAYDALFGSGEIPPPCPHVAVFSDANTITRFHQGTGRDIIDVNFEGEITDIYGSCEHDIDDDTLGGTLTVEISLNIDLARGPANKDRRAAFDYFVAVADASKNILNKKIFGVDVEFPGNFTRLGWTDYPDQPVLLDIPLKAGKTGKDFNIFVGFQLTREELEYNRRRLRSIIQ